MSLPHPEPSPAPSGALDLTDLSDRYAAVRETTTALAAPLSPEDQQVQSMPDASPTKWHQAHTTRFFETFLLRPHLAGYQVFDADFGYLFNSYYEAAGPRHARPERGLLTRPTLKRVADYRAHVDVAMATLMATVDAATGRVIAPLIELGLHHEQQHQELLLTDILHAFSCNPVAPTYAPFRPGPTGDAAPAEFIDFSGGIVAIGHGGDGFAFDHEGPRHEVLLRPYRLARRPVTNGEWREFMADGGYRRPELWLSDGWSTVQQAGWRAPLYWLGNGRGWQQMSLAGPVDVDNLAPVAHVSFYEADAFATWAGRRLPTEAEWEAAIADLPIAGNTLGSGLLRPAPANDADSLRQVYGDVWEWTQSAYRPYPGYCAPAGAVGEYNGKFMSNQMVLRGGSCVTPDGHLRATYRNFFYPQQRWQFTGLRLADDA